MPHGFRESCQHSKFNTYLEESKTITRLTQNTAKSRSQNITTRKGWAIHSLALAVFALTSWVLEFNQATLLINIIKVNMSNLDKTITFDTVRFVTYSEYISDVNDEFFDNDIDLASGEARKVEFHSRKHTDIIPFQLYIRVNYKSKRMTIEFSSKILFKDYPLLISTQTFRQCLLNIENLNICKLNIDKIIV